MDSHKLEAILVQPKATYSVIELAKGDQSPLMEVNTDELGLLYT